ncbi:MAG TPA: YegP family protein [Verrucomicrobiota bacterium]|nr:YegP family protein [Verrucomicrobiota bacterium]HNT14883.1 YegP family protein [Verrucomicrobiota bacterium]
MNGYYELKNTAAGKPMFNLKAGNHEVILTSEVYESKDAALNGIASVRKNGPNAASYEKKTSVKGEPFFVLKAANGQVIGKSEMYSSEAARDNGIASVITNSPSEKVVEAEA